MSMTYRQAHEGVAARWGEDGRIRLLRDVSLPKRFQVGIVRHNNFITRGSGDTWEEAFAEADAASGSTTSALATAVQKATQQPMSTQPVPTPSRPPAAVAAAATAAQPQRSSSSSWTGSVAIDTQLLAFEEITTAATLGAFAGEHLLMIGEPGAAKSLFARRFFAHFEGTIYETQFSKFADESILFGAPDMKLMRETGEVVYPQRGFAACDFAFLDELFDGSDVLLRCTLSGLQERKMLRGNKPYDIPLEMAIATANYTRVNEITAAVVDRFALTVSAPTLSKEQKMKLYETTNFDGAFNVRHKLPKEALQSVRAKAKEVRIPENIQRALVGWADGLSFTPRRHRKLSMLLRVNAALKNRRELNEEDMLAARFVVPMSKSGTVDNSQKVVQPLKDSIERALHEGTQLKQLNVLGNIPTCASDAPNDVVTAMKLCKQRMTELRNISPVSPEVGQKQEMLVNAMNQAYIMFEQKLGLG